MNGGYPMRVKTGLKAGGGGENSGGPVNPVNGGNTSVLGWLLSLLQKLWGAD